MAKTPEESGESGPAGANDDVSPLDRDDFLRANRENREKARTAAAKKAARKGLVHDDDSGADAAADGAEPAVDADDDGTPGGVDPSRIPGRVTDSGRSRRSSVPRWLVPALAALAVVLAVIVGVLGYLYATVDDDGLGPDSGLGEQALTTAKTYAVDIVSYRSGDYAELDQRIRSISTKDFADRYIKSSQDARTGNDEANATSVGTAVDAGLKSISENRAVVLVALDQKVTSPQVPAVGDQGLDYSSRVLITLIRDGDRWVVDDLDTV